MFVVLAQSANAQQNNHKPSPSASPSPLIRALAPSLKGPRPLQWGHSWGKKGIWGRRRARCRPRPRAQTAMKLPSSCFYCLSVLRSEPESSRREKKGVSEWGRGKQGGRFPLSRYGMGRTRAVSPTRGKKAKGSKVAQRVRAPAPPSPFAKSAWKLPTNQSWPTQTRLTNKTRRGEGETSKRARRVE